MQRINLPTKTNLIEARVKKISRSKVDLETLDGELSFTLPSSLLSSNIEVGEKLGIKILDALQANETHDEFARKLLEEIIN